MVEQNNNFTYQLMENIFKILPGFARISISYSWNDLPHEQTELLCYRVSLLTLNLRQYIWMAECNTLFLIVLREIDTFYYML